ncbi:NtaA/DmoA family FMN-dependent monooxygenase [Nocardioides campestrisoli]|uniref:NtaA/DmoA family FMN-dependent monooxygenase n=1 Tax=Nocardioides campestrisoli TaxID=2736757 RepID=UPI00163DB62F|nr:NtaA/DmoA family FMN-dependent monooxygenase [Nocardioides campestrisoli]
MDSAPLHLLANMQPSGVHQAAWRTPGANRRSFVDLDYYLELARLAERGGLDALFFADFAALQPESGRQPRWTMDPTLLLSAIAATTEHIGLVASISTTLAEPYHVARVVATLDHLSRGRAGWNVVTSFDPRSAHNFGLDQLPEKEARYRRAGEFVEVVDALWSSWEEGALALDAEAGTYLDLDRVKAVDHVGEFFRVAGPLQVPTPPQGRPVVFQAGASGPGRDLAARTADGVFAAQLAPESARRYRDDLRARASELGRAPEEIRFFPGVVVVAGETRAEALAKRAALDDLVGSADARLINLAHFLDLDPRSLRLDASLPPEAWESSSHGAEGFRHSVLSFFEDAGRTVGDFLREGSLGHRTLLGDPRSIADDFEEWHVTGAADGFVLMFDAQPAGLRDFVDLVVPELRRRGLVRTGYAEETLAQRLRLPRAGASAARETVGAGVAR